MELVFTSSETAAITIFCSFPGVTRRAIKYDNKQSDSSSAAGACPHTAGLGVRGFLGGHGAAASTQGRGILQFCPSALPGSIPFELGDTATPRPRDGDTQTPNPIPHPEHVAGGTGHWWPPSTSPVATLLAPAASFVSPTPRLPPPLLLKPFGCTAPRQSLGPGPGSGCSAGLGAGLCLAASAVRSLPRHPTSLLRVCRAGSRAGGWERGWGRPGQGFACSHPMPSTGASRSTGGSSPAINYFPGRK